MGTILSIQDILECRNESGIIIYDDAAIAVCNWSHCKGVPYLLEPIGMIGLPVTDDDMVVTDRKYVNSWRKYVDGYECIYDRNSDLETAEDAPAEVIRFGHWEAVAPEGWA